MIKVVLNGDAELVLPVTPERIRVKSEQDVRTHYNYWNGYCVRAGHKKPKNITFEAFFPRDGSADDYIIGDARGLGCVSMIEKWRNDKTPVLLTVSELGIGENYFVDSFIYEYTPGGDIAYEISLLEVTE